MTVPLFLEKSVIPFSDYSKTAPYLISFKETMYLTLTNNSVQFNR